MNSDVKKSAGAVMALYPNILISKMLIFPFMSHHCLSIIVMMNPIAAIDVNYDSRGTPVILLLQSHQSGADYPRLYRKIRSLLNRVKELDTKYKSAKKFDYRNLKVATPKGEPFYFSFHVKSGLGSNIYCCRIHLKFHSSTAMRIMSSMV